VSVSLERGWILVAVILAFLLAEGEPVFGQPAVSKTPKGETETYRLKETEITGQLKDVLGSMTLTEGEVVGSVPRPRMSYSLPWKDPDPLPLEEGEGTGAFRDEIYSPVDKDAFTREIERDRARPAP